MIWFIVFDATGDILRCGACPADHMAQQAGPGETAMRVPDRVDDTLFRVVNGEVVPV